MATELPSRIRQMSRIIMSSLFLTDDGLFLYGDDIKMSVSSLSRASTCVRHKEGDKKMRRGGKKCHIPNSAGGCGGGLSEECPLHVDHARAGIRALRAASSRPEKITAASLIKIFSLSNRQFGETHL
jgi:hypothetical protein